MDEDLVDPPSANDGLASTDAMLRVLELASDEGKLEVNIRVRRPNVVEM